jgi:ribosomal protein S18 acetylase RimI-like enzyme
MWPGNANAVRFYQKNGFVKTGEYPSQHGGHLDVMCRGISPL